MEVFNSSETLEYYQSILKDSIDHFIAEFHRGKTDFMAERMIIFRVMQNMNDPPLEFIWFYSAITFHGSRLLLVESSKKILLLKDLFQSIVSCSESCNGLQRVALLAPVLYILYSCSKRDLCVRGEIEGLVEGVLSYISICCADGFEEHENVLSDSMIVNFLDLVRVWNVDQIGKSCESGDALRLFFPLLSDEVRQQVDVGCGMRFLAGIVMVEFFLLRLCLRISRKDMQSDIKISMDQIVKGFQNSCFHDILLRMMLEPSLPVTPLLSSEEVVFLRKVLYDAVLLGEFPFLNFGRCTPLPENHMKDMCLAWLLVADKAVQFARDNGEHVTAISYGQAFSKSDFPSMLFKWVAIHTGAEEVVGRPNIPTPKALIEWLLVLEDQGIRISDENLSLLNAKAAICNSRVDYALAISKPASDNSKKNTFFDSRNVASGNQEIVYSFRNPFSAATCTVRPTAAQGRRKREEEMNDEAIQTKIVKYNPHKDLVLEILFPSTMNNASISGSQACAPANNVYTGRGMENTVHDNSDEDMEDMEDMG